MGEYVPFLRFDAADYAAQTVTAVCAVMLVAGLLSLLYGFRVYKFAVVLATALLGAYIGRAFLYERLPEGYGVFAVIGLALLGALAALPLQKALVFFAAAVMGFVSLGPVAAEVIWKHPEGPTEMEYLIAGVVAFLVMGILSLLLFKTVIMIATSLFGSSLVLSAMVHLVEEFSETHRGLYQAYPRHLAWTFAAIAVVGVMFQVSTRKKRKIGSR